MFDAFREIISSTRRYLTALSCILVLLVGFPSLLVAADLAFVYGGDSPWIVQSSVSHDGVEAYQSGVISNSQVSWMETTVVGPGAIRFWWKVSSEPCCDSLMFSEDGTNHGSIRGEVGWQKSALAVPVGSHTLRWTYSTDGSVLTGNNAGWVDEITFEAGSSIDVTPPATTAVPAGGVYAASQSVVLSTNEPAIIYYTTDGSDPTTASAQYSSPLTINSPATVKYFAVDAAGNYELIKSAGYSFDMVPPGTYAYPQAGTYSGQREISLYCNDTGGLGCGNTYYCLGSGCTSTILYTSPIAITSSTDLSYYSTDRGGNNEMVKTSTYIITPDTTTPTTTPSNPGGTYSSISVSLSCSDGVGSGCAGTYYCFGNGCIPATPYQSYVSITATTDFRFYSVDRSGNAETISTVSYVIDSYPPTTTPSVAGGIYSSPQYVALSCNDGAGSGCSVTYYCLGAGCSPSTRYNAPIAITTSTYLTFYSADSVMNSEAWQSIRYSIASGPPATISVPADQPTIQAAIEAAQDGDTVVVAPGTYVETINFRGKAITVTSSGGADVTIIDGNQAGSVVTFSSSEWYTSVLNGFTLRNGRAILAAPVYGNGGGIFISAASPIITNNRIVQNQGFNGAGIYAGGSPVISGNLISENSRIAGWSGGFGGGGIYLCGSSALIEGNTIVKNSMSQASGGGGIFMTCDGHSIIRGNTISQNGGTGLSGGGGIYVNSASVNHQIIQNIITANSSSYGGGIYLARGIVVSNNTVVDNSASDGTALYLDRYSWGSGLVVNNILSGKGGQSLIYSASSSTLNPPFRNNILFSDAATIYGGTFTDLNGINGNIAADPQLKYPALGYFGLRPGSPAIDSGDNQSPGLPDSDFYGSPRIVNNSVDIGAIESNISSPSAVISGAPSGFTNSSSASLTISGDQVVTYRYAVDGSPFTETDMPVDTPLVLTGLSNGSHVVAVVAKNAQGAEQKRLDPTLANWNVDTVAPVSSVSVSGGFFSGAQQVSISCSDGNNGSGCASIYYCLGDNCTPNISYEDAVTITSSTQLNYYANDNVGNSEINRTENFTIAEVGLTTVPLPFSKEQNGSFGFGSAAGIAFQCRVDNGDFIPCDSPYSFSGLVNGTHTFYLRGVDSFGQTGPSVSYDWTVNTYLAISSMVLLPQSGQKTCFDPNGNKISCLNTGQDGDYQTGLIWSMDRFVFNSNQTENDMLTDLMWLYPSTVGACISEPKNWQGALEYVACLNQLNYLGYADWRLPNRNELESRINKDQLRSFGSSGYWSSTSVAGSGGLAWMVTMTNGVAAAADKAELWYVRPVRGGQRGIGATALLPRTGQTTSQAAGDDGSLRMGSPWPELRFSTSLGQTQADNLTGLIWAQNAKTPGPEACVPGSSKDWHGAINFVNCLNQNSYQGFQDWRLPNRSELASLVNLEMANQSGWLASQGFVDVQPARYWTSTTSSETTSFPIFAPPLSGAVQSIALSDSVADFVNLSDGSLGYDTKVSTNSIWPVRGGYIPFKLGVTVTGNRFYSISASPGSITWNGGIGTVYTAPGSVVTLAIMPASATMVTWTGCDSSDGNTCTVTMTAAKDITAAFPSDSTPPVVALDSYPPNVSNQSRGSVSFSANEQVTYECKLDHGIFRSCSSPFNYSNFDFGEHAITIVATDGAGNASIPVSYTWYVDTVLSGSYTLTDLGNLVTTSSIATGINNSGQVVGSSGGNLSQAVVWNFGVAQPLNITTSGIFVVAQAINDSGKIAGGYLAESFWRIFPWERAFTWYNGVAQHLALSTPDMPSFASGINANGVIVGRAGNQAALWDGSGSYQNLGTLPGGSYSEARGINSQGMVAGNSDDGNGNSFATLWTQGSIQSLGSLGGTYSPANAINDAAQIVGGSSTGNNEFHAFTWKNGTMRDLGTLSGSTYSMANAVNNLGQIVGYSSVTRPDNTTTDHAVIWNNGVVTDLNDLVKGNGFELIQATGINDRGQIAGWGRDSNGETHAFLLTPETVNGQCGTNSGGIFPAVPSAGLCTQGVATDVIGDGHPWTWDCAGQFMGSTAHCSATIETHTITVNINGSGTVSSDVGFSCDSSVCMSDAIDYGRIVNLYAINGVSSVFSVWNGNCTGVGACQVVMGENRTVTASFREFKPFWVDGKDYDNLSSVHQAAVSGSLVKVQAGAWPASVSGPANLDGDKTVTVVGGYDAGFSVDNATDQSIVTGGIRINGGKLVVQNLKIR